MEITLIICAIIGILTAFTCIYCYRRGVKDGMSIKNERPLENIIEKPTILQNKSEKKQTEEDKKALEAELEAQKSIESLFNYTPKYTAKRNE